jgi:hypothetical protein
MVPGSVDRATPANHETVNPRTKTIHIVIIFLREFRRLNSVAEFPKVTQDILLQYTRHSLGTNFKLS